MLVKAEKRFDDDGAANVVVLSKLDIEGKEEVVLLFSEAVLGFAWRRRGWPCVRASVA